MQGRIPSLDDSTARHRTMKPLWSSRFRYIKVRVDDPEFKKFLIWDTLDRNNREGKPYVEVCLECKGEGQVWFMPDTPHADLRPCATCRRTHVLRIVKAAWTRRSNRRYRLSQAILHMRVWIVRWSVLLIPDWIMKKKDKTSRQWKERFWKTPVLKWFGSWYPAGVGWCETCRQSTGRCVCPKDQQDWIMGG